MPEEEEEEDQSNVRDAETNNEDQNETRTTLQLLSDEVLNPQVQTIKILEEIIYLADITFR